MIRITKEELFSLNSEDVVAIHKEKDRVTVFYMVESWESPGFDCGDDQYRIMEYPAWDLNEKTLSSHGLVPAVLEQHFCRPGGICYLHEDAEERKGFKNVYAHLVEVFKMGESPAILKMSNENWRAGWRQLEPGDYIIVIQ